MHLCDACRAERDWETDAAVEWQIRQNLAKSASDPSKARCAECTRIGSGLPTHIRNPLFQICRKCAEHLAECQHCRGTTRTQGELAWLERREDLLDLFTVAMKAYGRTAARQMFIAQAEALGIERVQEAVLAAESSNLDARDHRALWKKVLGGNIYRHPRFCGGCRGPRGRALCKSERCGHLTVGAEAAYCPLCATEERACEACGTSFE